MTREREILERLSQTYPRIREIGRGWALETAPDVFVPVPDPGNVLAYLAHQGRYTPAQLRDIQFALQKRVPVPPDPATIFYLEQLLEAVS
jgi:hypothetical protein